MEWAKVVLQFFQAAGTTAVAAIAIYGVFFTDIPQTLVRQLQTDVADARERLVDLQRERRALAEQNSSARTEAATLREERARLAQENDARRADVARLNSELAMVQTEIEKARVANETLAADATRAKTELEALETLRRDLERQIVELRTEREKYQTDALAVAINAIRGRVRSELSKVRSSHAMASQYGAYKAWREDYNKIRGRLDTLEKVQQWRDLWSRLPEAWVFPVGFSSTEPLDDFIQDITSAPPVAVHDILKRFVTADAFRNLLPQDRQNVLARFEHALRQNQPILQQNVQIRLPAGWSDADLERELRIRQGSLNASMAAVERIFTAMRAR